MRGYVSTCFGCPYEGAVAPERVVDVARRLVDAGCDEVSIGDTIGVAVPTQVADVMGRLKGAIPADRLAVHFHDTRGTALANVLAALQEGSPSWTAPPAASGAAPTRPGASGNLATEDLLYMLHGMGIETGVDLAAVAGASRALAPRLGRALPSRYLQAGPAARAEGGAVSETATILVVDDLPANRDLMSRRLERSGFRVVCAASGPEALDLLRRAPGRPRAPRHHDAGHDRARGPQDRAPDPLAGGAARRSW